MTPHKDPNCCFNLSNNTSTGFYVPTRFTKNHALVSWLWRDELSQAQCLRGPKFQAPARRFGTAGGVGQQMARLRGRRDPPQTAGLTLQCAGWNPVLDPPAQLILIMLSSPNGPKESKWCLTTGTGLWLWHLLFALPNSGRVALLNIAQLLV